MPSFLMEVENINFLISPLGLAIGLKENSWTDNRQKHYFFLNICSVQKVSEQPGHFSHYAYERERERGGGGEEGKKRGCTGDVWYPGKFYFIVD